MSARSCWLRHCQSAADCTGVPSLKMKGFGSFALLKPETVDAVAQAPAGLVGAGVEVAGAVVGLAGVVTGALVTGGGALWAAPGRHCLNDSCQMGRIM